MSADTTLRCGPSIAGDPGDMGRSRHAPEWTEGLPARLAGWAVEDLRTVETTQALARMRPAWSAVVALEQRSGRGQRERSFVSDLGGLYLSAVLPYAGDPLRARGFALAVGWAVRDALAALGVSAVRLRWPNDLMIGSRKLGGILVEQGARDTLVVGVGLNVLNQPWRAANELRATACSLAESTESAAPSRERLAEALLQAIRRAFDEFQVVGFGGLIGRLNASWGIPREVALELTGAGARVVGRFVGVSPEGDVEIVTATGETCRVPEHHIARLRET